MGDKEGLHRPHLTGIKTCLLRNSSKELTKPTGKVRAGNLEPWAPVTWSQGWHSACQTHIHVKAKAAQTTNPVGAVLRPLGPSNL